MTGLDRFALSFKTTFNGGVFRHVVCGLYTHGRYGALGMSRRKDLMYKPLEYKVIITLIIVITVLFSPNIISNISNIMHTTKLHTRFRVLKKNYVYV